jgi:hypothetical protein
MRRLLVVGALVLAGSVGSARAATITFEDQGFVPMLPFNAEPRNGDLTSGGFLFDMAGPNPIYQLANNSANINNGTTYLVTEGSPSLVTFSRVGGAPFALNSLDYAKWQGPTIAAATITVTGHRADNTTVMTTLSPVGDFTPGGLGTDFQKAAFGADWTNLASVDLLGTGATSGSLNYFAIDNVVVDNATVPEPGTLSLLGLASAYVIRRRNRR